jgi:tetratricopeptide (TPR) repeat protein
MKLIHVTAGSFLVVFLAPAALLAASSDAEFDALRRTRQFAQIETLARERLATDPKDDVALWHLGRTVLQDPKKRDELIPRAEQCIKDMPRSARCHHLLGTLYGMVASSGSMSAGMKFGGRMKDSYLKAVELAPNDFFARRDLNQFYLNAPGLFGGSVKKAIQGADEYSRFDPARAQVLRAEIHTHEEEFDEAESTLAAIKPGNNVEVAEAVQAATTGLGLALVEDGEAARARKLFERQVASDPHYAPAHFGLGRALLEQKMPDASIASLKRALELDPRTRAHYRLGIAYQGKGDSATALAMFRQFLTYSPGGRAADDTRKRIEQLTAQQK